jgi:hypothetical protein
LIELFFKKARPRREEAAVIGTGCFIDTENIPVCLPIGQAERRQVEEKNKPLYITERK